MKTKKFSLGVVSILAVILLTSLLSAAITFTNTPSELSKTGNSFTITINSDENETITLSGLDSIVDDDSREIIFSIPAEYQSFELNSTNSSKEVTINYNVPADFNFELGDSYSTLLLANGTTSNQVSYELEFEEADYCVSGENGSWIVISDVTDEEKDNEEPWEWRPLDDIEITVEIDNERNDDIEGVIKYGIYDTSENEFIFEDEIDFDVDEDEDDEFTIEFTIDPEDLNEDTGDSDYIFYIKVYDDDDGEEESQCQQFSEEIEIKRNDDEIALIPSEIEVIPQTPSCGTNVQITAKLYNIGTDDQEDVIVYLTSNTLNITLEEEINDIKVGDSETIEFSFDIPEGIEEGNYDFQISILDEDGDIYEIEDHDGDDEDARYVFSINVEGNCQVDQDIPASVSAILDSEQALAGEEIVIKATIVNTGDEEALFAFDAENYDGWATLVSVEPTFQELESGSSTEVTYTFEVDEDVEGEQTFNIIVQSGDFNEIVQPVAITIEQTGFNFEDIFGDNWYLWLIGLINLVLVIIIIIVAVRIAKK